MKEILASGELEIGMFVTDLDRPWIDSPFLLQGFLIEDRDTLGKLQHLCRFVSIDRSRSVGEAHRARRREDVSSRVGASLKGQPLRDPAVKPSKLGGAELPNFIEILRAIRSGRLAELPEVRSEELEAGAEQDGSPAMLAEPTLESLGEMLRRGGMSDFEARARLLREHSLVERELVYVAPRFARMGEQLERLLEDVRNRVSPDLGPLREGIEEMVRSVARNPDALIWLTRLRAADEQSYQRSLHTSVHMMVFARSLGMGEATTRMLGMAGILHDVGKVRLPPRLLAKSERLTPLEYEIFKTHVDYSLSILREVQDLPAEVNEIVARHHERYDGTGYPAGLAGDAIGMAAEIAGLVDSYTAMTNKRTYGSMFSTHQALEDLIRLRGSKHREGLVDQFVQCIGIYPVGSLVELNSGEVAVVIGQNRVRRLKPRVMVLLAPDKSPNRYPPLLDLLYDPVTPSGEPYAILRALPPDAHGIDPQEFYLG